MKRRAAIIWVWGLVLIAGAVGGGYAWWRQQDVAQAYEAGRALADSQKWEEALALAQPYAERDDPRINGLLADAYINGPEPIQDIDKGLTLRRRAAEAGDMRAAYFMGMWILEHEPTDTQAQEAIGYIQEAADCGMPMANYYVGKMHENGMYFEENIEMSLRYIEVSASSGIRDAVWDAYVLSSKLAYKPDANIEVLGEKSTAWLFRANALGDKRASKIIFKMKMKAEEPSNAPWGEEIEHLNGQSVHWLNDLQPVDVFECGPT
jgi:TPR repeat protein